MKSPLAAAHVSLQFLSKYILKVWFLEVIIISSQILRHSPSSLGLKKDIEQLGFGLDWDVYTHLKNCRYKYLYPVFQIVSVAT